MRLEVNLPALERLLGGDTEIEAHLRQQVTEQFAQKHLKAIINRITSEEVQNLWKEWIRHEVSDQLGNQVRKVEGYKTTVVFDLKAHAKEVVREQLTQAFTELVNEKIDYLRTHLHSEMTKYVALAINRDIDKIVREEIARRLEAAKNIP